MPKHFIGFFLKEIARETLASFCLVGLCFGEKIALLKLGSFCHFVTFCRISSSPLPNIGN